MILFKYNAELSAMLAYMWYKRNLVTHGERLNKDEIRNGSRKIKVNFDFAQGSSPGSFQVAGIRMANV